MPPSVYLQSARQSIMRAYITISVLSSVADHLRHRLYYMGTDRKPQI